VGTERLRPVGVLHVDGYVGMPGPFLTGVTSLELSLGRGNEETWNDPSQQVHSIHPQLSAQPCGDQLGPCQDESCHDK
jgi:hypothetical protein